jgi:SAM-dependent methyltransferase
MQRALASCITRDGNGEARLASERSGFWSVLESPAVYEIFHHLIGARRWLRRFADETIRARDGDRVLDIGCGPGALLCYLPRVTYIGIDRNASYINQARRTHGDRGHFICDDVSKFGDHGIDEIDIAVAYGLLHHVDDDVAKALLAAVTRVLTPGGRIITVDPCYHPSQSRLSRFVVDHDRGRHVRQFERYPELVAASLLEPRATFVTGLLPIPHSVCIVQARRARESARNF